MALPKKEWLPIVPIFLGLQKVSSKFRLTVLVAAFGNQSSRHSAIRCLSLI